MIDNRPEALSVARCTPREMQRATIAEYRATGRATPTQRAGLKGLALQALSRNGERNGGATVVEKTRNDGATPDSSGATAVATTNADLRARLLTLADDEGIDPALVQGLPESELAATAEQVAACDHGDCRNILSAYVRALADSDLRRRGKVPADETAMALCRGCGPVWVHPAVADAAPVIDGWPRLLGCQWCVVRHAGLYVPRPQAACGTCRHFMRDAVNPEGGMGRCKAGCNPARPYPNAEHQCARFTP